MGKKSKKKKKLKLKKQQAQKQKQINKKVKDKSKKKAVIPNLAQELKANRKGLNTAISVVLIIASIGILGWLGWQIAWKALTPDTLFRFLPLETVIAVEQYGHSPLPVVKKSQKLLQTGPSNLWLLQNYPTEIEEQLLVLKPERFLQSWAQFAGELEPIIIIQSSLTEQADDNQSIQTIKSPQATWYFQQFEPGYFYATTNQSFLQEDQARLSNSGRFFEAQHNQPDQYYAALYLNPQLAADYLPNQQSLLLKRFFGNLGATLMTMTPGPDGFNLLSYTTPTNYERPYPHNQNQYQAELAALLPDQPVSFVGGIETSKRLANLLQAGETPLQSEFSRITKGLQLPEGAFSLLLNMFDQEFAYAEYPEGKVALVANVSPEQLEQLETSLLAIYNYLNPQRAPFELRDGTFGQKLVAGDATELPQEGDLKYLELLGQRWFWQYDASTQLLSIGNNYDLLTLTGKEGGNFKDGQLFYERVLPILTNRDELVYFDANKLSELTSEWPETVRQNLDLVESATLTTNFFPDGIQTYNYVKLKQINN